MTRLVPTTVEQFEDDPPVVVASLDRAEVDDRTLTLTPDRADQLAAALTTSAAAARAGHIDIRYQEDTDR